MLLDTFASDPVGIIGPLDMSWGSVADSLVVGGRVSAEVVAVDFREKQLRLSRSATENPQLRAYLKALCPGQQLSGAVVAIERFGIFVDLDDGPDHPVFPGVFARRAHVGQIRHGPVTKVCPSASSSAWQTASKA